MQKTQIGKSLSFKDSVVQDDRFNLNNDKLFDQKIKAKRGS